MGWVTKWTIRIRQRNVDLLIHNITNRTQLVRSQYQIILTACEKYFLMSICLAHYILSQAIAWNMLNLWSACAQFSCMSWFRNEWQFLHLNSVEFHFCASIFVSPAQRRWAKLFLRVKVWRADDALLAAELWTHNRSQAQLANLDVAHSC